MTEKRNLPLSVRSALLLVYAFFAACSFGMGILPRLVESAAFGGRFDDSIYVIFAVCYGCLGVVLASAPLLAIGAVFGPGQYWVRIPLTFCMGLGLIGCWFVGTWFVMLDRVSVYDDYFSKELLGILLFLPLLFLVVQSPLWIVRLFFNWRLIVTCQSATPSKGASSTIGGMLAAMALIGVALAGVRVGGGLVGPGNASADPEFWVWSTITSAVIGVVSALSSLPSLVATLRARRAAVGMGGLGIYTALWLVLFSLLTVWRGPGMPDMWWGILIMSAMVVSFMTAVAVPLVIARRFGYRLQWGRETLASSQPSEPVTVHEANPFYCEANPFYVEPEETDAPG